MDWFDLDSKSPKNYQVKYHCFLSHNWGHRQEGGTYDNHEFVRRVYNALENSNIHCWFNRDEEEGDSTISKDNKHNKITLGIKNSDVFVGNRYNSYNFTYVLVANNY